MAFSTGTRSLIGELSKWGAAAIVIAVGLTHWDAINGFALDAVELVDRDLAGGTASDGLGASGVDARDVVGGTGPREVHLKAQRNGHYLVTAELNGRPVEVLVDTGATLIALTYEDAERAGVSVREQDFTQRVGTANGTARVAPVRLERVEIDGLLVRDVEAVVSEPGRLATTLLGMSFISRLARVEMRQGEMVLAN